MSTPTKKNAKAVGGSPFKKPKLELSPSKISSPPELILRIHTVGPLRMKGIGRDERGPRIACLAEGKDQQMYIAMVYSASLRNKIRASVAYKILHHKIDDFMPAAMIECFNNNEALKQISLENVAEMTKMKAAIPVEAKTMEIGQITGLLKEGSRRPHGRLVNLHVAVIDTLEDDTVGAQNYPRNRYIIADSSGAAELHLLASDIELFGSCISVGQTYKLFCLKINHDRNMAEGFRFSTGWYTAINKQDTSLLNVTANRVESRIVTGEIIKLITFEIFFPCTTCRGKETSLTHDGRVVTCKSCNAREKITGNLLKQPMVRAIVKISDEKTGPIDGEFEIHRDTVEDVFGRTLQEIYNLSTYDVDMIEELFDEILDKKFKFTIHGTKDIVQGAEVITAEEQDEQPDENSEQPDEEGEQADENSEQPDEEGEQPDENSEQPDEEGDQSNDED